MGKTIELMNTGDGSHTLLNTEMNETYHSRHGALRESQHVFINKGLNHFIDTYPKADTIDIFEMGLGTGLNLILTLQSALSFPNLHFNYTTLEAYPLEPELLDQLNYLDFLKDDKLNALFKKMHQLNWNEWHEVLPNFRLKKVQQKLEDYQQAEASIDLIYYDAFAPNKQAELWTLETMRKISNMLRPKGVLVTYCAKGQLKRDLKSLALTVETLEGPPGKAEMVRASKLSG
ncbi:tRNA (5-methylaminomethyl-2-thiouridine)(34)-methyltransferase MnmD [Porifericola rhodea]|uniref:tRNA (5-methylaminomethyl-2-thiouridine)(34)-methyltransferase MnmD n=1 Tax=Porifericola rhodea TaxID=930972 RepID=UPI0026653FD3|nr:tRNA (5-methylaminomethyl-2-thiouridine)(34)-methyltransferase MnmD [Porifericola rhodea]WKN31023.1 tRNA (5-methylaminomethyl-2-thiouridine)(34)-methyltransferase MnmD [Porifericola rhodea]